VPFNVPNFNLNCNVWRNGNAPPAAPNATFTCNLALGRRVSSYQGVISTPNEPIMSLLLPVSTDVRGPQTAAPDTCVEVPAGSGRFYTILGVDDSGKGFPNEHRVALIAWTSSFGAWPAPIP
jgi:hypothetical protein